MRIRRTKRRASPAHRLGRLVHQPIEERIQAGHGAIRMARRCDAIAARSRAKARDDPELASARL
jgi:hypothetical protein